MAPFPGAKTFLGTKSVFLGSIPPIPRIAKGIPRSILVPGNELGLPRNSFSMAIETMVLKLLNVRLKRQSTTQKVNLASGNFLAGRRKVDLQGEGSCKE
jgi:hypothetical protein